MSTFINRPLLNTVNGFYGQLILHMAQIRHGLVGVSKTHDISLGLGVSAKERRSHIPKVAGSSPVPPMISPSFSPFLQGGKKGILIINTNHNWFPVSFLTPP